MCQIARQVCLQILQCGAFEALFAVKINNLAACNGIYPGGRVGCSTECLLVANDGFENVRDHILNRMSGNAILHKSVQALAKGLPVSRCVMCGCKCHMSSGATNLTGSG
ncbi:hypothetical protein TH30_00130 [Thalassospira profundimaris]|uniref:Uncharacterized protein n=1 Tax=Thalassospira profundimaris TaxID=502049 RepID=A0A367X564_9PROT|nr:hypothetical protein TH30_00130 [Thalassospira profundimaris]